MSSGQNNLNKYQTAKRIKQHRKRKNGRAARPPDALTRSMPSSQHHSESPLQSSHNGQLSNDTSASTRLSQSHQTRDSGYFSYNQSENGASRTSLLFASNVDSFSGGQSRTDTHKPILASSGTSSAPKRDHGISQSSVLEITAEEKVSMDAVQSILDCPRSLLQHCLREIHQNGELFTGDLLTNKCLEIDDSDFSSFPKEPAEEKIIQANRKFARGHRRNDRTKNNTTKSSLHVGGPGQSNQSLPQENGVLHENVLGAVGGEDVVDGCGGEDVVDGCFGEDVVDGCGMDGAVNNAILDCSESDLFSSPNKNSDSLSSKQSDHTSSSTTRVAANTEAKETQRKDAIHSTSRTKSYERPLGEASASYTTPAGARGTSVSNTAARSTDIDINGLPSIDSVVSDAESEQNDVLPRGLNHSRQNKNESSASPEVNAMQQDLMMMSLVKEEHKLLEIIKQCVVCKSNPRNITFLPCGHFIACRDCAEPMYICVHCNRNILATVNTYLS